MKRWGYPDRADDARLDAVARTFAAGMKRAKTAERAEPLVRTFMRAYLAIGDDPTDTVIRDNAWAFLERHAGRLMPERALDAIWQQEVRRKDSVCVVC